MTSRGGLNQSLKLCTEFQALVRIWTFVAKPVRILSRSPDFFFHQRNFQIWSGIFEELVRIWSGFCVAVWNLFWRHHLIYTTTPMENPLYSFHGKPIWQFDQQSKGFGQIWPKCAYSVYYPQCMGINLHIFLKTARGSVIYHQSWRGYFMLVVQCLHALRGNTHEDARIGQALFALNRNIIMNNVSAV